MKEDESTKLRSILRRAIVHTWISTAAAAVLIAAILAGHARGGELMDCEPQPVRGDGRHWAYRIIDGRECWYPGERGKPKQELRWAAEAPSAPQQRFDDTVEIGASPPEPAPQQPGAVERSEVEGPPEPTLDLAAASPEPTIEAMPEVWRAAAADQLLAFTCCWPELPEAVPPPQPGLGRRIGPTASWLLILLPLALCAMWSIRKLASKKLRRLLSPNFGRPSVPPWWRWLASPGSAGALTMCPADTFTSSSTNAHRPTKLARIDGALVPLAPSRSSTATRSPDSSRSSAKASMG